MYPTSLGDSYKDYTLNKVTQSMLKLQNTTQILINILEILSIFKL